MWRAAIIYQPNVYGRERKKEGEKERKKGNHIVSLFNIKSIFFTKSSTDRFQK